MAVRRVRRVIRKIDPWTVLKVSLIFNAVAGLIFVLGTWVSWSLAVQRGIPDQVTEFFENFALVFTPEGELYFRVVVLAAIVMVVLLTAVFTLGAVLYNLISDVVGGVEIIVLEETYPVTAIRQAPVRPAVHMPAAEVDTVQDDSVAIAAVVDDDAGEEADEAVDEPDVEEAPEEVAIEGDVTVEEDVTVEDDEAPIAAASEG